MDPTAKTAIRRRHPSAPMRWLYEHGLLLGHCLDYGCGRGEDAKHYGMAGWDPNWNRWTNRWKWDTITCVYVLNVLGPVDQDLVIRKVHLLLKRNGRAYFVVRRDMKPSATQYWVELGLPLIVEKKGAYAIYAIGKAADARL